MSFPSGRLRHCVGKFGSLDSFGSDLEEPGEDHRDWKANNNQQDNNPDCPVRNVENRKYLRDSLGESPSGNYVGDGDFVNVAPFQLG